MVPLLAELFGVEEPDFSFHPGRIQKGLQFFFREPERAAVFGAWAGRFCLGMATGQLIFSTGVGGLSLLVEDVVVAGRHRNRGIGSALLVALQDWAIPLGARRFELRVDENNEKAMVFYGHRGWQETRMKWLSRVDG